MAFSRQHGSATALSTTARSHIGAGSTTFPAANAVNLKQGPRPAGRRHRGMSRPRGLRSATNGVLLAPGFCDRGFGDCCCRLGRPVAYFDGTLKVFHEPYLLTIRNGSVEPLLDRPGPRAQFERRRDEFLPSPCRRPLHKTARNRPLTLGHPFLQPLEG
jgi:hypothetical protein